MILIDGNFNVMKHGKYVGIWKFNGYNDSFCMRKTQSWYTVQKSVLPNESS